MAELTKEQLETAYRVFIEADSMPGGSGRFALRAAAPYLQLPWDEINICEFGDISFTKERIDNFDLINRFVRRRNAALLPKPVDSAVEIVSKMLRDRSLDDTFDSYAEKLVKAVREAK